MHNIVNRKVGVVVAAAAVLAGGLAAAFSGGGHGDARAPKNLAQLEFGGIAAQLRTLDATEALRLRGEGRNRRLHLGNANPYLTVAGS